MEVGSERKGKTGGLKDAGLCVKRGAPNCQRNHRHEPALPVLDMTCAHPLKNSAIFRINARYRGYRRQSVLIAASFSRTFSSWSRPVARRSAHHSPSARALRYELLTKRGSKSQGATHANLRPNGVCSADAQDSIKAVLFCDPFKCAPGTAKIHPRKFILPLR